MKIINPLCFLFVFLLMEILPFIALATDSLDITSGLNTLPLLVDKITGDTTIGIAYNPLSSTSASDAHNIKAMIDAGEKTGIKLPGRGKLSAILVSVNELGKLSRARIAFLTPGLEAYFANINTATSAASILTITTDIDCVRAAKCIIGIETKPNLTIYYSKSAADSAKIEFSQSFSMLVKQP